MGLGFGWSEIGIGDFTQKLFGFYVFLFNGLNFELYNWIKSAVEFFNGGCAFNFFNGLAQNNVVLAKFI